MSYWHSYVIGLIRYPPEHEDGSQMFEQPSTYHRLGKASIGLGLMVLEAARLAKR